MKSTATLDNQYSQQSYDQIEDMVINWQQDNNITLQQTMTTTTTKEVIIPNRTQLPSNPLLFLTGPLNK